jgi:hypothetical protein
MGLELKNPRIRELAEGLAQGRDVALEQVVLEALEAATERERWMCAQASLALHDHAAGKNRALTAAELKEWREGLRARLEARLIHSRA